MTGEHTAEQVRPAHMSVLPVNRTFRVAPDRLALARRASTKLIVVLGALAVIAVLPWVLLPPAAQWHVLHWTSLMLGVLVFGAGLLTWGIHTSARWWLDDTDTVLTVTNDEIVIRGTIHIPTNLIVGVWGYEQNENTSRLSRSSIRRLLSVQGASTSSVTLLLSSTAPVLDPHHRVRRFKKDEEVAGRIEIPVGAYLDHEGALDDVVATIAGAMIPGRPAVLLIDSSDYIAVWSGYPSRVPDAAGG